MLAVVYVDVFKFLKKAVFYFTCLNYSVTFPHLHFKTFDFHFMVFK